MQDNHRPGKAGNQQTSGKMVETKEGDEGGSKDQRLKQPHYLSRASATAMSHWAAAFYAKLFSAANTARCRGVAIRRYRDTL